MTRPIRVAEDIVPIGRFRADTAKLLERLSTSSQPLVITQNGEAAGIVISPAEFDRMRERQALLEEIAAGMAQIEAGDAMSTTQVRNQLRGARTRRKRRTDAR